MALIDIEDDLIALAETLRPGLLRVSRLLRREAQKAGVSALDAQLLGAIVKQPGVSGGELAEAEQMSAPSMSAHLKRLEAAGWIEREPPGDGDRRRVGLRVTPAGEAAVDAIRAQRNDWLLRDWAPSLRRTGARLPRPPSRSGAWRKTADGRRGLREADLAIDAPAKRPAPPPSSRSQSARSRPTRRL